MAEAADATSTADAGVRAASSTGSDDAAPTAATDEVVVEGAGGGGDVDTEASTLERGGRTDSMASGGMRHMASERLHKTTSKASEAARRTSRQVVLSAVHQAYHIKTGIKHVSSNARLVIEQQRHHIKRRAKTARRRIYNAPRLLLDWHSRDDVEVKPSWTELFYDLIYVAACIKLSAFVKSDISFVGVMRLWVLVLMFWRVWLGVQLYFTRFEATDPAHRAVMFLHCLAVMGMAIHVGNKDSMPDYQVGISVAAAAANLALLLQYVEIYWVVPRAVHEAKANMVFAALNVVVYVVSLAVPYDWVWYLWAIGPIIPFVVRCPCMRLTREERLPVHTEHFGERHALLSIVLLGESVVSIILPDLVVSWQHYLGTLLAFAIVFQLETLVFHAHPVDADDHALRRALWSSIVFLFVHVWFFTSAIGLGAGIKVMLLHIKEEIHAPDAWLLCTALSAAMAGVLWLRFSHVPGYTSQLGGATKKEGDGAAVWVTRWAVALSPLLVPIGVHAHVLGPLAVLGMGTGIVSVAVVVDTVVREKADALGELHEQHGVHVSFHKEHGHGHGHATEGGGDSGASPTGGHAPEAGGADASGSGDAGAAGTEATEGAAADDDEEAGAGTGDGEAGGSTPPTDARLVGDAEMAAELQILQARIHELEDMLIASRTRGHSTTDMNWV